MKFYKKRINYEFAPVFALMETTVLKKMRSMIGWGDGDGIFAPGCDNYCFCCLSIFLHLVSISLKLKKPEKSFKKDSEVKKKPFYCFKKS